MIRITLVDVDASSHEKLAKLMLNYGKLGYSHVYTHEEFENEMFLTDSPIELDEYYEEMKVIGEASKALEINKCVVYQLVGGPQLLILGKGQA